MRIGSLRTLLGRVKDPVIRTASDRALVGTIGTSLFGQLALIVSGVIVARVLGPEDRGHLAAFVLVSVFVSVVVGAGLPIGVTLELATGARTLRGLIADLRAVFVAQAFLAILLPAACFLLLYRDAELLTAALLTLPLAFATLAFRYGLSIMQGQQQFARFNLLRSLPAVLYAFGVLVGLIAGVETLAYYSVAQTLASMAGAAAVVFVSMHGDNSERGDRRSNRDLLKYGVKAQFGAVSPLEELRLDQVAVGTLLGSSSLGIYVVATAFTNLPRFVAQSMGMVLFPRIAERAESEERRRITVDAMASTALICGGIVAALAATVGFLIPLFFGDEYGGSVDVARVLLVAAFLWCLRRVLGDALRGVNRPVPGATAELVTLFAFLIAVVPMTLALDEVGAAVALAVASGFGLGALILQAPSLLKKSHAVQSTASGEAGQ